MSSAGGLCPPSASHWRSSAAASLPAGPPSPPAAGNTPPPPWWSGVIASGVDCFLIGLCSSKMKVEEGVFGKKDILLFNLWQIAANAISWLVLAPILDIVIYSEPAGYVFTQGVIATLTNAIASGVIGTLLLVIYSKTRSKKGSLSQED